MKQITEHELTDNVEPVVSISSLAFNHENYVCDTIEGFLIQKTTFPVEILIHDDASTDNTADIIRQYEKKYPETIKPIYQTENQYSQGNKPEIINRSRARGKYIALCEGDDYWTDLLKLQKQVDFLEENQEYSMVCTNYSIVDEDKNVLQLRGWKEGKTNPHINQKKILGKYTPQLLTVLIRKSFLDKINPDFYNYRYPNGDTALFSAVTEFGPCYFMDEVTGCYRHVLGGMWAKKDIAEQLKMKHTTFQNLSRFYSGRADLLKLIHKRLATISRVLTIVSIKSADINSAVKYFYRFLNYKIRLAFFK